jgi:hypothetical protein
MQRCLHVCTLQELGHSRQRTATPIEPTAEYSV